MHVTAINKDNDRLAEMMFGKAMCAYANHESAMRMEAQLRRDYGDKAFDTTTAAQWSEYEATVRCIDMFVEENIYTIQRLVREAAEREFGI